MNMQSARMVRGTEVLRNRLISWSVRTRVPIVRAMLLVQCSWLIPGAAASDKGLPPGSQTISEGAAAVDFIGDVQPLLSRHCVECHGPKKREGGLRLDVRSDAFQGGDSGPAVTPGDTRASELITRVVSEDESLRMPLNRQPLAPAEVAVLRSWIQSGAAWPDAAAGAAVPVHWSFLPPQKPVPPTPRETDWVRNPIDQFVLARLEAEGLHHSPEADRHTLLRRVSLDLIGLPPSVADIDAFLADQKPGAFERLVDRLLDSPHYGERWARLWLDLARYADTNGYEKDRPRSIWPWRDWVISALNQDMPFDQFTIEQLAGDMLPDATISQQIATGFHRNTMQNEEGGIDPEEDRFKRTVDRVGTTATTWLGLTIACAQCHSHKYDPISQQDFYRIYAILNNANEQELPVPDEALAARRAEIDRQIADLEADLEHQFPVPATMEWQPVTVVAADSAGAAILTPQADGSILATGPSPDKDVYTIVAETALEQIAGLRLEVLPDETLPQTGPGRAENGNFVVSEIQLTVASRGGAGPAATHSLVTAEADFSQADYAVSKAIDGDVTSAAGWAIYGPSGPWNVYRAASFGLEKPAASRGGSRLTVTIHQQQGGRHTLGRFRISCGNPPAAQNRPIEERRRELIARQFEAWQETAAATARRWTVLTPASMTSNAASFRLLDDGSILVSGDATKRDVYEIEFPAGPQKITALRLDALPHPSLPGGGPGREFIDNPGDFYLSSLTLTASRGQESQPIPLVRATHSFARSGTSAQNAIDHDEQTAWLITGGTGRAQTGVFELGQPLAGGDGTALRLGLTHVFYYPASLGRFRVSVTSDPAPTQVSTHPESIERILTTPAQQRTADEQQQLLRYYLSQAPELAAAHARIAALRSQRPVFPTTLVMQERRPEHPRVTPVYHRGEFLDPRGSVRPGVPRVLLDPVAGTVPENRLEFARWLVDRRNPLTARVTVNRMWAAFFGRGLVRTTEDFGSQGEPPSHPELLDWLATEFMDRGWSQKTLHRLIVTSSVYRQSSRISAELSERDPRNILLARGPRLRVDAEMVRDIALTSAGLLSPRIGGPGVFPPQPEGITSAAFGALTWNTEDGENRYRRGLYTFSKRTAPYASFATFDAPSGEFCTVRRERSNTPLQALTLMNDVVFIESAQALARRVLQGNLVSDDDRLVRLFQLCLTRPPAPAERRQMQSFLDNQRERFRIGSLPAAVVGGTTQRMWSFDSSADGWEPGADCRMTASEGLLQLRSTGTDPFLRAPCDSPAGDAVVKFRARFSNVGSGQWFWGTNSEPQPTEVNSVKFEPVPGEWREYSVELKLKSDMTWLRFDPGSMPGDVELDWIELRYGRLPAVAADPSEVAAWTALARVLLNVDAAITRE